MRPIHIITVAQSRNLETRANQAGMSYAQMMENAGRGTADAIQQHFDISNGQVVVLVGPGNNGGDGLVAAHYLAEAGARVACYVWNRSAQGDANLQRVCDDEVAVAWADEDAGQCVLRAWLSTATVIVDALLGVGVTRPIDGTLKDLLHLVNKAVSGSANVTGQVLVVKAGTASPRPKIVAVDCPSGLNCDTGALDPAALPADLTVTLAYPKAGLVRFPGAEAVGDLVVVDIGLPAGLLSTSPDAGTEEIGDRSDTAQAELATVDLVRGWLPTRPRTAHKGTFGRVLIVAGSSNYLGAAALAGSGALRVGAGLVTLGLPMPIQLAVAAHLPEATYLLLPHDLGVVGLGAVEVLRGELDECAALLVGPGLGQEPATEAFVHGLLGLEQSERRGRLGFLGASASEGPQRPGLPPLIVDADGLNLLARAPGWWKSLPPDTILTPHPGEMARLMAGELEVAEIQLDREAVARRMAVQWNSIVVLKGAFTVVAAPNGRTVVIPFANSGLATAGSGDVLAGGIAGLRAQGMPAFEAAVAGAFVHGLAGDLVREQVGEMGMIAGDLPPRLPLALRLVRTGGQP